MYNRQAASSSFPEHNEQAIQQIEAEAPIGSQKEEQMLLDYLMGMGFVWEEAVKLLQQRLHLYENTEMRQRVADDSRMHFARWLYEHGEIREA